MSITSAYEKLQREGKLNKPIRIQQPTPDNPHGGMSSDGNFNVQNIMNEKVEKQNTIQPDLNELNTLKNRVTLLEETLLLIMKQHTELMRK